MAYVSMKKMLKDARAGHYAVGAFNIVNYLTAKAVVDAACDLKVPVILQTSVKTVKQFGIEEFMSFLRPICENASVDVAVHLDHCTDKEYAKRCMDAGWSSIMFDGSKTPLEQNIKDTLEVKDYISGRDISLEGEVGSIVGVEDDIVVHKDDAAYASREDCEKYLKETGVDCLAPAIGTAHGVYKGEIKLNYDLFKEIDDISPVPLVLHGGTGLSDEMFGKLIDLRASKVNISTAIKIAYCQGMYAYSSANRDENDPLKLDDYVYKRIYALAFKHINFFTLRKGSINDE
ncbi:class II fructose-bisphosphate aldolase [Anaerofustis stercorihominis]|uniref:Class II fructose-bisphosphate aldolase n=1 Tax=Anaerofustis stercorihominis TaxID=214853 RepID=A0A3E3DZQ4_9FIRM|nr:class II fructose-bisphosphate aldolase [Anaerofustis stercorihominis]MCQ4794360.1 class II fructose-bisphosphate aldolase [Anaerofustis stercorihominis]RGD74409.1 class II fructose-bisphosphate aldolase [Anaerofustis stercorihominis]